MPDERATPDGQKYHGQKREQATPLPEQRTSRAVTRGGSEQHAMAVNDCNSIMLSVNALKAKKSQKGLFKSETEDFQRLLFKQVK